MYGFAGHDPLTGAANWRSATLAYELVQEGQHNWLIRRESQVLTDGSVSELTELVLAGPVKLVVSSTETTSTLGLDAQSGDSNWGERKPILNGLAIEVFEEENERPIYEYRFRRS